jgi:hypothetical protein
MQTTSACKPSGDEVLFNREGWKFRKGRELTSGMDLGSLRCEKGWNFVFLFLSQGVSAFEGLSVFA